MGIVVENLSADELRVYDGVKYKCMASCAFASAAAFTLALLAVYAGQADSALINADGTRNGDSKDVYNALASGYGIGSAVFGVSFVIFVCASVFSSPLCCGTKKEAKYLLGNGNDIEAAAVTTTAQD